MIVIAAHDLGEHIETASTENEIDYLIEFGDCPCSFQKMLTGDTNADHACQRETKFNWIGHCNDLHDLGIDQIRDTLTYTCLGYSQIRSYFCERSAPILL